MPDINQLTPALKKAYEEAKAEYIRDYPNQPRPILTCTYRSKEEQNRLYAQGRTAPGAKVTQAKGGQSPHNYLPAMAFDVSFTRDGGKTLIWDAIHYHRFAPYVTKHAGIRWGGDWDGDGQTIDEKFVDLPHFEVRGWAGKV